MKSEMIFNARVSKRRQDKSAFRLIAQRKAVQAFAEAEAFKIVNEYVETEAGNGADALSLDQRGLQLRPAVERRKYSIVFAKLDRLSRDVEFISA